MTGVSKIAIAESVEILKSLIKKQKNALNYARVQALYLIKIPAAETIRYLTVMIGRSQSSPGAFLSVLRSLANVCGIAL